MEEIDALVICLLYVIGSGLAAFHNHIGIIIDLADSVADGSLELGCGQAGSSVQYQGDAGFFFYEGDAVQVENRLGQIDAVGCSE